MKKGAIELSANFIVVLALSAVLIVGGFILIKNIFTKTIDIKETLDEQTELEIENMLSSGAKVAIPFSTKEAEKGKLVTFGIGILNILKVGSSDQNQFSVSILFKEAYSGKNELTQTVLTKYPNTSSWLQYSNDHIIKKNENKKVAVGIKIPKDVPSGDYIFNVEIKYSDPSIPPPNGPWMRYDDIRKIIVKT
ncbi:hypothetical protein JXA85_08025 [Candidatus Woesearchaeota archaeon]|nr:hypothetical protein [Candidatus Woesearchaeota archaeon]